jgi:predicted AAA+ superfamily ATPase
LPRLRERLDGSERGFLLETWVLQELRAAIAFQNLGGQLHYWRTPSGTEVDFIWTRAKRAVGIEVKAATTWRGEYSASLKTLLADKIWSSAHGVYTGATELKDGDVRIWPLQRFLRELAAGNIPG